jgi:hypothetical protein
LHYNGFQEIRNIPKGHCQVNGSDIVLVGIDGKKPALLMGALTFVFGE